MEKKIQFSVSEKNVALTAEKKYSNYDLDNIYVHSMFSQIMSQRHTDSRQTDKY